MDHCNWVSGWVTGERASRARRIDACTHRVNKRRRLQEMLACGLVQPTLLRALVSARVGGFSRSVSVDEEEARTHAYATRYVSNRTNSLDTADSLLVRKGNVARDRERRKGSRRRGRFRTYIDNCSEPRASSFQVQSSLRHDLMPIRAHACNVHDASA